MANELTIISSDVLTSDEATALESAIQRTIEQHKNNRQAINRLVFESVEAMTEMQDAQATLNNKTGLRRLIGSLTGSNKALQDKINENHAVMQYVGQQMLKALDEQSLMTFELITAVDNKLKAMQTATNEEFKNIYEGLRKFVEINQSNLVQLASRLEQAEQNAQLATWGFSIKYAMLEGTRYADLDDAGKIVCIARDFYEITKGNWSTSDLLVLQGTMDKVKLDPDKDVNYFAILQEVGNSPILLEKLFAGADLRPIQDPSYLISMGTIGKIESLQQKDAYIVEAVSSYLQGKGVESNRDEIAGELAKKYIVERTDVNVDTELTAYELMLDLLYSLKQVEAEGLLGPQMQDAEENRVLQLMQSEAISTPTMVAPAEDESMESEPVEVYDSLKTAEQLVFNFQIEQAFKMLENLAEQDHNSTFPPLKVV